VKKVIAFAFLAIAVVAWAGSSTWWRRAEAYPAYQECLGHVPLSEPERCDYMDPKRLFP
jgi:hypothetical protein